MNNKSANLRYNNKQEEGANPQIDELLEEFENDNSKQNSPIKFKKPPLSIDLKKFVPQASNPYSMQQVI